jgi:hypothetical protein
MPGQMSKAEEYEQECAAGKKKRKRTKDGKRCVCLFINCVVGSIILNKESSAWDTVCQMEWLTVAAFLCSTFIVCLVYLLTCVDCLYTKFEDTQKDSKVWDCLNIIVVLAFVICFVEVTFRADCNDYKDHRVLHVYIIFLGFSTILYYCYKLCPCCFCCCAWPYNLCCDAYHHGIRAQANGAEV